ncbi:MULTISPECIES: OmpA/MotB family protein [Halomonadaceae]|uniref:OmpA/MotB family protein n=1 Tax=Halomonadaceae TaxID=28256 RepID=UPI001E501367|nr:OmpA family protein [Halomonas sp. MES3-P3E]
MSFSDLMSGLLVIFILAAVALIIELTQKTIDVDEGIEELKKAEQAREDILNEVRQELSEQDIEVLIADNDTVIRIPESTLSFESGEERIPADQRVQNSVRQIGLVLHQAITRDDRLQYLDTVFIEGHTDSDAIFYRGKGNWGLSTDRAISIWNTWLVGLEVLPAYSELENIYGQRLFSVSGYAASRRVQELEETPRQKAENRRIDIRFTVKPPSIADLERIKPNSSKE